MTIHIEALSFEAIIGLLDFERKTPQPLSITLEASYAYQEGGDFIDYALLSQQITHHLQSKRYGLLEEALLGLEKMIRDTYPNIEMLFLKITKPTIIQNAQVGVSRRWEYL